MGHREASQEFVFQVGDLVKLFRLLVKDYPFLAEHILKTDISAIFKKHKKNFPLQLTTPLSTKKVSMAHFILNVLGVIGGEELNKLIFDFNSEFSGVYKSQGVYKEVRERINRETVEGIEKLVESDSLKNTP